MPILNYTTKIAAERTAGEIQQLLGSHGAKSVTLQYTDGKIAGVAFLLDTEFGVRAFELPIRTEAVRRTLIADGVTASLQSLEHAHRVAWRIAKDWLKAQLALIDAGMASTEEVMLPYMVTDTGDTLFVGYQKNQRRLTKGTGA